MWKKLLNKIRKDQSKLLLGSKVSVFFLSKWICRSVIIQVNWIPNKFSHSLNQLINMLIIKSAVMMKCYRIWETVMPTRKMKKWIHHNSSGRGFFSREHHQIWRCQLTQFNTFFKKANKKLIILWKVCRASCKSCGIVDNFPNRLRSLKPGLWRS